VAPKNEENASHQILAGFGKAFSLQGAIPNCHCIIPTLWMSCGEAIWQRQSPKYQQNCNHEPHYMAICEESE